jgi:uncharacterized protein (DUF1015 family)
MAKIRPFIGLRPKRELAPLVAELPYDVLTSEEAREVAAKNEYSFYHITKPEVDLPEQVHVYDDRVYQTGRENLNAFIRSDILQLDESPNFFLYTLIMEDREQTGLVACVHIDDYANNVIRKHELTREEKELDRSKHMDVLNAQTGLVFMLYRETGGKNILLGKGMDTEPEYDFITSDNIRHIFRVISDKDTCARSRRWDRFLHEEAFGAVRCTENGSPRAGFTTKILHVFTRGMVPSDTTIEL